MEEQVKFELMVKTALDELGLNYTAKGAVDFAMKITTSTVEATILFSVRQSKLLLGSIVFEMPIGQNLGTFLVRLLQFNPNSPHLNFGILGDAIVIQSAVELDTIDKELLKNEIMVRLLEFKSFYDEVYPVLIDVLLELDLRLPNNQSLSA
jgi:hypothetical protein